MSLSEQTARVAGSGKNTLKILLQKLGVPVGDVPIDQYPALAQTISGNLNPDKLLNPSTAQLYGEESDAGPDDLFQAIYYAMYGSPDVVYRWSRIKTTYAGEQSELRTNWKWFFSGAFESNTIEVAYSSSYQINTDGTFKLVTPTIINVSVNNYDGMISRVAGKYFAVIKDMTISTELDPEKLPTLYRADGTFQFGHDYDSMAWSVGIKNYYDITAIPTVHSEIVTSSRPDTYPVPGDGWTYTSLASVQSSAGFAKIEYGTYVGSGVYGADNPNQLTFTFQPKLVCISGAWPWVRGAGIGYAARGYEYYGNGLSWEDKTLRWSSTDDEIVQLNESQKTYHYVALG